MTEQHEMEVRWAGDSALGKAMVAAAKEQGFEAVLQTEEAEVELLVKVVDHDLQALRDRVDHLLVTLSALEEAHNG